MNRLTQYGSSALLAYAAYTFATCPCEQACGCKAVEISIAIVLPLSLIVYENYLR